MAHYSNFVEYMGLLEDELSRRIKISDKDFSSILYKYSIENLIISGLLDPNASIITTSPYCGRQVVSNKRLAEHIVVTMYPVEVTWYTTASGHMAMEFSRFISKERELWYDKYFAKRDNILEYSITTSVNCVDAVSILTVPINGKDLSYASAHLVNDALPPEVYLQIIKIFQKDARIPEKAIHYFVLFYYINFIKKGNCWFLKKTNRYVALITNREIDNGTPLTVAYGVEYFISNTYSSEAILDIILSLQRQLTESEKKIYLDLIDYIIGIIIPYENDFNKSITDPEIQSLSISIRNIEKGDRLWILRHMVKPIIMSYIRNKNMHGMMEFIKISQKIIPDIKLYQYCLFLLVRKYTF
jgi:hypothetical protein